MTAITLTEDSKCPIPGVKKGAFSAGRDGYTSKFGLSYVRGVVLTMDDNDDVIVSAQLSAGTATLGMIDDAGAAVSADSTGFYWAWGDP